MLNSTAAEPFAWHKTCVYVISLANSSEQQAALAQFGKLGSRRVTVWPGVTVGDDDQPVQRAWAAGLVPQSYASDARGAASALHRGTTGNTLAHLTLLQHILRHGQDCSFAAVFEDDVCLLRGFSAWSTASVLRAAPFDFVNLHTVRAWGAHVRRSALLRVDPARPWPAARVCRGAPTCGKGPKGRSVFKSPNMLAVAYVVRRRKIGALLDGFARTSGWRRHCTIDQVLGRLLHALAGSGQLDSFVVEAASGGRIAHCGAEQPPFGAAERRAACAEIFPALEGRSRSRAASVKATPAELTAQDAVCTHNFCVPGDLATSFCTAGVAANI